MSEYVIQGETLTAIADAIREKKGMIAASEYMQLEYIESTDAQYIDTEYYVTSENLKIVACFAFTEIKAWAAICGVEGTTDKLLALTPMLNAASTLTFYSGSSSQLGAIPVTANTIYSLTAQTVDGVISYDCNGTTGTAEAAGTLCKSDSIYIFTLNSASDSNVLSQATNMRLYSFQLYDNDVLVRDFVPCAHTDGTVGLYDLANDKFYTNAGSGTFTAGAEVAEIGGSTGSEVLPIPTTSMAEEILSIETGSTPESVEQATPSISVSSAGLITASATQEEGYVPAGTKTATLQMVTRGATTYTPGTADQTISASTFLTGRQTVKGDSNLVAANIKSGVSIFSVSGTYEGTAAQIKTGAFTTDENGEAAVSCGFTPDCVAIYGGVFSGGTVYSGAMFTQSGETTLNVLVGPSSSAYVLTLATITQTSSGFSVVVQDMNGTFLYTDTASRTFNYVALKYT